MSRAMFVGGVKLMGGEWVAIAEIHSPCHGGQHHRECTVTDRYAGSPFEKKEDAMEQLYLAKGDLEKRGLLTRGLQS